MRIEDLQDIIVKAHAIRGEELPADKAMDIAWIVLSFFGYSDHCLANALDSQETALFYDLQDMGILKPESKTEIPGESTAEWRMIRWTFDFFGISKIKDRKPQARDDLQSLYASLPPEAFIPAGEEEEMTVQVVPEEGITVLNGGSEDMENGKIIAEQVKERIEQLGKEKVSQKFMEAVLKDLSGGDRIDGYGTVQVLVHGGFLKPNGDDGYIVERAEDGNSAGPSGATLKTTGKAPMNKCHECEEEFPSQQKLMIHMMMQHPFDEDLLKKLLAQGKSPKEIQEIMNRSKSTVKYHISRLGKGKAGNSEDGDQGNKIHGTKEPPLHDQGKDHDDPLLVQELEEIQKLRDEAESLKRDLAAAEAELKSLQEKYQDARKEKEMFREDLLKLAQKQPEGVLLSSIHISRFNGYYDGQKRMIASVISDEITKGGKGKEISVEVWDLPPERRVILTVKDQEGSGL